MSSDQGRALLYKGAGAIILLMVALIIFFKAQPDEPIQPVLEWSKASHPSSIITNGIDRLAVMENFNQLDTQITDVCFSPVNLNPQQFQSQRQYRLTKRFLDDMKLYKSAEQLSLFIETTRQVIAGKGEVPPSVLDQFNNLKGSAPILESNGDQEVLQATFQIANTRLKQLNAHEQINLLKEMTNQGLLEELERSGVEITRTPNNKILNQNILRYWELTSTRYILCHSGNRANSEFIQNKYQSKYRPVYINAINTVIDPVKRRFDTSAIFNITTDSNGTQLRLRESEGGSLALMTFKGALPRAKLYTDWITEPNPEAAKSIAFSAGFIPQAQVVLHTESISKPEQPALTVKLDPIKIIGISPKHIELDVPPLEHNAVLLINNDYDQKWKATISNQKIGIIRANLNACAIYLKPMGKNRLVSLQKP